MWWRKASALSIRRNAPAEAIGHCTRALEILALLSPDKERGQTELSIQIELGSAVLSIMGWADPRAGKAYERALDLCRDADGTPEMMQALYGLGAYYMVKGDQGKAVEITSRYLRVTESVDDLDARISAHFLHGIVQQTRGLLADALEHLNRSLELMGPGYRESQLLRFGQDFKASALWWLTKTHWHLGHTRESDEFLQRSFEYARERDHPYCWAWAYANAERQGATTGKDRETYAQGLKHSQEYGYAFWVPYNTACYGGNLIWKGRAEESLALLDDGIALLGELSIDLFMSWYHMLKGAAFDQIGDCSEGLRSIEKALDYAEKCDERDSVPEIYRVKGELLLKAFPLNSEPAQSCFERGLSAAREQGCKSYELRCATSYARHLKNLGRFSEARDLLRPIHDWFTGGYDTKDLKDAKALLDELGQ